VGVVMIVMGMALAGTLGLTGIASAYSINQSTTNQATNAINLPQLPAGTFNLDWAGFLNSLPFQNFFASLKSASTSTANNSSQIVTTNTTSGSGKMVLQQIDDWTSVHLGFRFSELFGAVLGALSWVLGFAKGIVDWLLNFLH
jgi:hypothetical protein